MSLKPNKNVQKILISTTSRLIDEYKTETLLITHAFDRTDKRRTEGPMSRHAFIIAFETEPDTETVPRIIPDYTSVGDRICALLSVLYGKRFDNHGMLENMGIFLLPDLSQFTQLCDKKLPQNTYRPRIDFEIPLELNQVAQISDLIMREGDDKKLLSIIESASKFYLQALQNVEVDPEVAYLHLITAGEIIANYPDYAIEDLLDERKKQILDQIRKHVPEGDKVAKEILKMVYQVKKRFVQTICSLVDDAFFDRTEAFEKEWGFKTGSFKRNISAAYDLRSNYVHTGISFGSWVHNNYETNEVQIGNPILDDKELAKTIGRAPTYIGLERVIRYCLMNLIKIYTGQINNPQQET